MSSEASPHIFFFPFMSAGHMIPMLNMAGHFARHGARATVLTTPSNVPLVRSIIHRAAAGPTFSLLLLPLPSLADAGLPDGWDSSSSISVNDIQQLHRAVAVLRPALRRLLAEHRPDCLVSDMFLPWTTSVAEEHGVPRLVFHGMCLFSLCVLDRLKLHRPQHNVSRDDEPFVVPGLPRRVEMTLSQLPEPLRIRTDFNGLIEEMKESEARSYGVVVNSFREMEPGFIEHFWEVMGKKAWHVGPVSLFPRDSTDTMEREVLEWLHSVEEPGSVLYVCFGSLSQFSAVQLQEIAVGLEASGKRFIWVLRGDCPDVTEWLPKNWNKEARGLMIRGWAPQIMILNHEAVGGFLTHCGWNSVLEGVTAGVPMFTWPVFGDQFFNEILVVEVLEIGIRVMAAAAAKEKVVVKAGEIDKAVRMLMGSGEEAEGMRRKTRTLGEVARVAMEEGGSSYNDMGRLMKELNDDTKRVFAR